MTHTSRPSSRAIELAPAKVNLSLHVLGRFDNGYHDLDSLVAFAGCADVLTFELEPELSIVVDGPTAAGAGPDADNLVLRAARELASLVPNLRLGRFNLVKRLPAAAGLGGGSSDAAAALRLLARANGLALDDPRLFEAGKKVGADVPVCIDPRARVMAGVGDQLEDPLALPPLFAVLVNPRVALETRAVFHAMGLKPGERSRARERLDFAQARTSADVLALLARAFNDMEPAACGLSPAVAQTLGILAREPGARLARMSGSGATCFALFETRLDASRAGARLRAAHPAWWVCATVLR